MFKQTKTNTVILRIGQYFKDLKIKILKNLIIFKKLPAIGATSAEIESEDRNSILIEPNVPVIIGKHRKYNTGRTLKILGVYEGKTEEYILDYLQSSVFPKKIIVTPESFRRVKEVIIHQTKFDFYNDFFLLFDECERTIQDVSYRSDIILPMVDFFKFRDKAFISATPIIPSDPRFISEKFKALYIEPDFDYKQDIQLINTNNVYLSFKKYLHDNPRDKYFVFFKSTESIGQFVKALNIESESAIFCAKESKQKLKANGFTNVYTTLEAFKKYNFLTSRFFSAVDIDYETYKCDPTIIMITDLVYAQHSMIDPLSEAIQIVGRFREPDDKQVEVKKEIVHISNFNPELTSMSRDEAIKYVSDKCVIYNYINGFYLAATNHGAVDALREMIERTDYKKYINLDGERNYFMQDNIIHQEQVKGFYQSSANFKAAYILSNYFNVSDINDKFQFSDIHRKNSGAFAPLKSIYEIVIPIIHHIHQPEYNMYLRMTQLDFFENEYPNQVKAYRQLGFEAIKKLDYNNFKIREALKSKETQTTHFGLLECIEKTFSKGEAVWDLKVKRKLGKKLTELGIHHVKAGIPLLRKYCQLTPRLSLGRDKAGREYKGYRILEFSNKIRD